MVDHVIDVMNALEIARADLNGWSMGGRMALLLAARAPERVRRLILTAPAGIGTDTIINFRLATVPFLGEILTRPSRFGMRLLMKAALYDHGHIDKEMLDRRVTMAQLPGAQAAFLKQLRNIVEPGGFRKAPRQALLDAMSHVSAPTLAVWGKADKFVSAEHAKILETQLAHCEVAMIERCGHLPQLEHPDAYANIVSTFLQQQN